jgi:hypothetical protein
MLPRADATLSPHLHSFHTFSNWRCEEPYVLLGTTVVSTTRPPSPDIWVVLLMVLRKKEPMLPLWCLDNERAMNVTRVENRVIDQSTPWSGPAAGTGHFRLAAKRATGIWWVTESPMSPKMIVSHSSPRNHGMKQQVALKTNTMTMTLVANPNVSKVGVITWRRKNIYIHIYLYASWENNCYEFNSEINSVTGHI